MHFYLKTIIILISLFTSCTQEAKDQQEETVIGESPEILTEPSRKGIASSIYSDVKRGYKRDLVAALYEEALDNDKQLELIEKRIGTISEISADSLQAFSKYQNNSNSYWLNTNDYLQKIGDSTLRNNLQEMFAKMQKHYGKKTQRHELIKYGLDKKKEMLYDQHLMLKLIVSMKLMSNYLENECPDIENLKWADESYGKLLEDIGEYTEKTQK